MSTQRFVAKLSTLAVAMSAALALQSQAATYVFTTIDYPGAVFTDVRGVNSTGKIVGYAWEADLVEFAFVYSGGTFTRLPAAPTGELISGHGINDSGVVVGTASTATGGRRGFVFQGGTYTFHSRPGAGTTYFRAIDSVGRVTGYSEKFDAFGNWLGGTGFIFDPATNTWTDITVPTAALVIAQGINTAGTVVGSGQERPGGSVAFVRDATTGTNSYFQISGLSTKARGINNAGLIAGFVEEGANAFTFVGAPPTNQNIAIAGMPATIGEGINDAGQVAGLFRDVAGNTHGFIATPAELPTGTTSSGGFSFSVPVEPYVPVFIDPEVALGYQYEVGKGDPLFASVRLPIGIGDSLYSLVVNGRIYPIAGGQLFDFRANGYANGVSKFRVTDIELDAALDPANPYAFPTELTFTGAGRFTGSMTPLCLPHDLPAQAGPALRRALSRCVR